GLPLPKEDLRPLRVESAPSWMRPLWFAARPVAVVAYLFFVRRATLHVGYCAEHLRERRNAWWARMGAGSLVIGSAALFIYVATTNRDPASFTIFPPMLATAAAAVFATRVGQRSSYPYILEVQDGMVRLIPGPGYPVHTATPAVLSPPRE
ncbi:MAG TPA: hypothetical protein PKY30_19685, partial [Myxococcota bacterium]|nr:hypothetical protein [Myxococcota bacterium]